MKPLVNQLKPFNVVGGAVYQYKSYWCVNLWLDDCYVVVYRFYLN